MLQGTTVYCSFIDRDDRSTTISKKAIITDYEQGGIKVIVTVGESSRFSQGHYDLVFSYTTDTGLTVPLYCDLNMRPNFTVEVSEDGDALPLTTQIDTAFQQQTINGVVYYCGSALKATGYYDKPNGLVTLGVYGTGYTGNFYIQGALSDNPTEHDWFDITLGTGTQTYFPYQNLTGIDPWTFRTNVKFLRAKFTQPAGTLDKVVIRV